MCRYCASPPKLLLRYLLQKYIFLLCFDRPKSKYIRITKDESFHVEEHVFSTAPAKAEAACSYDLDECDMSWMKVLNSERATAGLGSINEDQLERVIERLEVNCWDKIQLILRNEEGLGIEYDENVICDVCRSPDSEEGNEMVFCDSCNICVHQACYGKFPCLYCVVKNKLHLSWLRLYVFCCCTLRSTNTTSKYLPTQLTTVCFLTHSF